MTQSEMLEKFGTLIKERGLVYNKKGGVFAKKVVKQEQVDTMINGIKETTNTAQEGDFIVQNNTSSGEFYVLTPNKIASRYQASKEIQVPSELAELGFEYYKAVGACKAIEYTEELGEKDEFFFLASWGEEMLCQRGDMLVCPINDGSMANEVYRIEKQAFRETYE